jgi:hypothetical protein
VVPSSSQPRLLIAERFVSPAAGLTEVLLPLDVLAQQPAARLRLVVLADGSDQHRVTTLVKPSLAARDSLRLAFAPFDSAPGATFVIGAVDTTEDDAVADLRLIREHATGREPIVLRCRGADEQASADLLCDERGMTAFRVASQARSGPDIRIAYWLDAYWCDPFGIFLRGWVHAFEHRVRALRVEAAGHVARVESFSDRPDLLEHYPEHEHVRRGGFVVYLDAPAGHAVRLIVETDAGEASIALPLPHGPVPPWPGEEDEDDVDGVSLLMRRFTRLANELGGRVLQIGSRTPRGEPAVPPRHLLRKPLIGLDIHPGWNVNLVGDAHAMSRFIRAGSLDGVLSASVLEHIQAPWVVAAEINRVLKPGGLVYQQVPGAWPAHAQPNDFWRFSSEGLRVLFGAATGFEVLEARDCGRAAIIPSPDWRSKHLDMPTVPAFAMAEVLARKVADVEPGTVAWPLQAVESESRSHLYPLAALRPSRQTDPVE